MRLYGDHVYDQTVVAKVLRSLTPRFDHVLVVIEESKDLTIIREELSGSVQALEARINKSSEKSNEKVFQVEKESS